MQAESRKVPVQCNGLMVAAFPSGWVPDTSERTRGCENKRGERGYKPQQWWGDLTHGL